MEMFTPHIARRKFALGEASRQSQISFMQTAHAELRHLFFWATFVTGDGLANQLEPVLRRSLAFKAYKR
jgi:hypothetical protein